MKSFKMEIQKLGRVLNFMRGSDGEMKTNIFISTERTSYIGDMVVHFIHE